MRARIAIASELELENLIHNAKEVRLGTPYGIPSPILVGNFAGEQVALLLKNGKRHDLPPHAINYRANVWALRELAAERVIAVEGVGSLAKELELGDMIAPDGLIDFTRSRPSTFFEEPPATCIDFSEPFCPDLRKVLLKACGRLGGTYACLEGPRYETRSEAQFLRKLGLDMVGYFTMPEAALAREYEICYALLCVVTRIAGKPGEEHPDIDKLKPILESTVAAIPEERKCECSSALRRAVWK